jgi:hypothetical protein
VTVRLFTGHGAGVYLLFAVLAFQVPRELSAPHADTVVVIAKANNARLNIFRISILLLTLRGGSVSAVSGHEPGMVRVQSRLRKCTIADRTIRGPSISYGDLAYHRATGYMYIGEKWCSVRIADNPTGTCD